MMIGELYRRLILFTDDEIPPMSYHEYYERTKAIIEEMWEDLPPSTIKDDALFRREIEHFLECWRGKR